MTHIVLASALAAIGLAVPLAWFLTPIGLGLFFYTLWYKATNGRSAAIYGFIFGLATAAASTSWLWDTLPLHWLGIFHPLAEWYVLGITWLLSSSAVAIVTGVAALALWMLRGTAVLVIIAPLIWFVEEQGRMWFYSVLTYGPGALLGPHFSLPLLGYPLAENGYLIQLASLGGIDALNITSAILATILALLYAWHTLHTPPSQIRVAVLVCALVLVVPFFLQYQSPTVTDTRTVAIVSTNFSPDGNSVESPYLPFELIQKDEKGPDVVLLPEGRGLPSLFSEETLKTGVFDKKIPDQKEMLIISSGDPSHVVPSTAPENVLTYESTKEGTLGRYHKMILMPQGEYIPYISSLFLKVIQNAAVNTYTEERAVTTHGDHVVPVSYGGITWGALLCSDILSPYPYRSLARDHGATVLVNLADTSWFRHSPGLHAKELQLAKVHAVWNRAYFLRSANASPSFAIDPKGRVIAATSGYDTDILYVQIPVQ